jgi:hypothetical protein
LAYIANDSGAIVFMRGELLGELVRARDGLIILLW